MKGHFPQPLKWLLVLAGLLFGTVAYGRPDWVDEVPRENKTYRFYVGRSADAPNESMAFNEATRDAYEQAIRESFGVRMQVDQQSYEGTERSSGTKYMEMISRQVEIHGFEQVNSYAEKAPGHRVNLWVLYRYGKKEIRKETDRLRHVREEEEKPPAFSDVGSTSEGATLEIVTIPSGASVLIDGTPSGFAKTPLRLSGALFAMGRHELRIDHPDFEPIEESIILTPNRRVRVERRLVPATGTLRIITDPPNANVLIAGKPAGTSPTEAIVVPAGRPLLIELSHAESEKLTQEVVVGRNENRELSLKLPLKEATLSIVTEPSGAEVTVGGRSYTTPTGRVRLSAGHYSLQIAKEGYESRDEMIDLHGGENQILPTINLQMVQPREAYLGDPRWRFTVNPYQLNSASVQSLAYPFSASGIEGQYKFCSLMGVSLSVDYIYGSSTYSNGTVGLDGFRVGIALPVYLFPGVFVQPEWTWLNSSYSVNYSNSASTSTPTNTQFFYGGSLGALYWFNEAKDSSLRWGITGKVGAAIPYQNPSGLQGETSWHLGVGVIFGF